jgi:hypothetical protein
VIGWVGVGNLKLNGFVGVVGFEFGEATVFLAGGCEAILEAGAEEGEGFEKRRFAATVGANED